MPDSPIQSILGAATTPIAPDPSVGGQSIASRLSQPGLNDSVWSARLKGFGGGALDAMRGMTSPLALAGSLVDDVPLAMAYGSTIREAAPAISAATKMMSPLQTELASRSAADVLNPSTATKMAQMFKEANPTFKSLEKGGAFAGDRSVGGLHSLGSRVVSQPTRETLGEVAPQFTPQGGEGIFNAARPSAKISSDPVNNAYMRILATMGR